MKSKKFRVFCVACFAATALQIFIGNNVWANDLQNWQKGVIEGAFIFNPHLRSKDVRVEIHGDCAI